MCIYIGHRNNALGLFIMLIAATNTVFSEPGIFPGVLLCIPAL